MTYSSLLADSNWTYWFMEFCIEINNWIFGNDLKISKLRVEFHINHVDIFKFLEHNFKYGFPLCKWIFLEQNYVEKYFLMFLISISFDSHNLRFWAIYWLIGSYYIIFAIYTMHKTLHVFQILFMRKVHIACI